MKKMYFFVALLFLLFSVTDSLGQLVLINENNSLDGIPFNGRILLGSDRDSSLWVSDGTADGTTRLSTELKSASDGSAILNGSIYFAGMTDAAGIELWRTDGTAAGTALVSDILPGANGSKPESFIEFNGKVYFTASTPEFGRELYEYTGSGSPTRITDLNVGSASSFNRTIYYKNNGKLYFNATDGTSNALYLMEGSAIKQLFALPSGFFLDNFAAIGNTLFFTIRDGMSQSAIYKSDGTPAGTTQLQQFSGIISGVIPMLPANIQNKIYFLGTTDELGTEPYTTDGNTTTLLRDINPGRASSVPLFMASVVLNGKIIFSAETDDEGLELWSTDGTPEGTMILKDINTEEGMGSNAFLMPVITGDGSDFSTLYNRTANFNGFIFFAADQGDGMELWKTDGTADGTVLVKKINSNPGEDGIDEYAYIYTNSGLIFSGDDGTGSEPWISDGTAAGTRRLVKINPSGASKPEFNFIWNGDLYLSADNGNGGIEEYRDFYKLTGPFSALPIVLLDFTARTADGNVLLSWSTSTESNSDKFIILRSSNGTDFNDIGSVAAAGNSNSVRNYSYTDDRAYQQNTDKLFYQLKMVDKDGKSSLSKIVSVHVSQSPASLRVYPNPVQDVLRVEYSATTKSVLTISDLSGKTLHKTTLPPAEGGQININTTSYPNGTFVLKLLEGSKIRTTKFVKK